VALSVSRAVWQCSEAKGNARLVLLALADSVWEKGIEDNGAALAWLSQRMLAERCRCQRSTVEAALRTLKEDGEIEDTGERRGGYSGSIVWSVLPYVEDFSELPGRANSEGGKAE
jgi:hypothetical protein